MLENLEKALLSACREGKVELVKELLDRGANMGLTIKYGTTPLMLVCFTGNIELLKVLLDGGADINYRDEKDGFTALHIACQEGKVELVKELLDRDADMGLTTNNGNTPLMLVCFTGYFEVLKVLLDGGADINYKGETNGFTALHIACQKGKAKLVKELLDRAANMDLTNEDDNTPLMVVCFTDYIEVLKMLLDRGADINYRKEADGFTALHIACQEGKIELVKELLDGGADMGLTTKYGNTPLMQVCFTDYIEVLKVLLDRGADINYRKETDGFTALHTACQEGKVELVKELLDRDADMGLTTNNGSTPLMLVCFTDYVEVLQVLLDRGADINYRKETDGFTALHTACQEGKVDVVKELLDGGADVKIGNDVGESSLHIAVRKRHFDVAVRLLHHGAGVNARNNLGDTPLHEATTQKRGDIARMLWLAGADPFKRNNRLRSARSRVKIIDRELYNQMRSDAVPNPVLPPLPDDTAIAQPAPPTPLQDELNAISQDPSLAGDSCRQLITQENCQRSLSEWFAAHAMLILAVDAGQVDPRHLDTSHRYYWREQLYCTISDFAEMDEVDKQAVYKCLEKAKQLNLIDTVDTYIHGIYMMRSINLEICMLQRTAFKLLEYIMALEFSLERLRKSFQDYRKQQMTCNLLGIAIRLIPVAGGAAANMLLIGADAIGEMSGADVVECTLTVASTILEEQNFSSLHPDKQRRLDEVFQESGFTRDQVRAMLTNRRNDTPLIQE